MIAETKIVTFLENDFTTNIELVLSRLTLSEEKKKKAEDIEDDVDDEEVDDEEPEDEDEDGNIINNGWLNPKSIKKGLRERETKLAELKANGNVTEKRGNSGLKAEKQKHMAKTKNHVEEPYEDSEDDPF